MSDLRELTQEDVGSDNYLHLPTVVAEMLSVLAGADVRAILIEEVGMHPSQLGVFEDLAPRIMELATAWARRAMPNASLDACLSVGQAIGELTGGDMAFGPPGSRAARKVYDGMYDLITGWNGPTATPEATRAILAEVAKRYG